MSAMRSSYGWIRQRWKRTAACRGVFKPHTLGLHQPMVIKRIDFDLSRLKQGFDSPRERQNFQRLRAYIEKSSNIR
jgi:hypothetical protein